MKTTYLENVTCRFCCSPIIILCYQIHDFLIKQFLIEKDLIKAIFANILAGSYPGVKAFAVVFNTFGFYHRGAARFYRFKFVFCEFWVG